MTIVYLRVSTGIQDVESQKIGVVEFCKRKEIVVDKWVEDTASGTKAAKDRKLGGIIRRMKAGDLLITSEISRLSRNMLELMSILKTCMEKGAMVMTVKEGYELGNNLNSKVLAFAFGLTAEMEREMISARTKEGMARAKAAGKQIGRPVGSKTKAPKLSLHHDKIASLIAAGHNQKTIAKKMKVCRQTIATHCRDHGITTKRRAA